MQAIVVITVILVILCSCGAFNHFLLRGYCIPGIPLEDQHAGCEHGFDTSKCIPDSVGCAPSANSDFWKAGQDLGQVTHTNPLEMLGILIVICVVMFIFVSLMMTLSHLRNRLTHTDPIPATNEDGSRKGHYMRENERSLKAESMAIRFVISLSIIGYLIYLDQIHKCIQLSGTTSFCF